MKKRLFSALLALCMVLTMLPLTGLTAFAATSGDFNYEVLSETGKTCEITDYTGSATALDIPSQLDGYTVTSIGNYAFAGCDSLTSITIPSSVTSIEHQAFSPCASLTSITIPDSVTSIGTSAFRWCDSLTSITIPDSVTSIGNGAFEECNSLISVTVDGDNPNYSSENGVLFNKDKTVLLKYPEGKTDTTYIIPDSVTSIEDYAFVYCDSLEGITISDSVTSIEGYTFLGCDSLESITIRSSNPNYSSENGVLFNKDKTELIKYPAGKTDTTYIIPDSVTSIGDSAFRDCTSLTSITISDGVTSIGGAAFSNTAYYNNADNWENGVLYIGNHCIEADRNISGDYTIKAGTKTIADSAFSFCTSLESITIPDSVTSIGDEAFSGCDSLTSVTIGNGVTSIGDYAFEYCDSLVSVSIGDNVTSIGASAFAYCASLTSITIPDSVTSIGNSAFSGCDSLESITIPGSVTSVGRDAFSGCANLTSLTVLDGVKKIEGSAFRDCTNLSNITLPDSIEDIENSLIDMYPSDGAFENTAYYNDASNWENGILYIGNHACDARPSERIEFCEGTLTIADMWLEAKDIYIPRSVQNIGDNMFMNWYDETVGNYVPSTIHGYTGTYAETYARENGHNFVPINSVSDAETQIYVVFPVEEMPAVNTVLRVDTITATSSRITHDITLTQNGVTIQPAGTVTVMIPVPETMDGNACKVYRQEADGTYTDMNATYRDGYMVFTTDHFSVYVLTTDDPTATTFGDVNVDGKVDAVDARWVLQAAAGMRTLENATAADVNTDSKIDAVDARWILQAAAGMRTLGA